MKYNISLLLEVSPDANFFEVDRRHTLDNLEDLIKNAIYDIDDVNVTYIEVQEE